MIRRFRKLRGAADLLCDAADADTGREELAARVRVLAEEIRSALD